MANNITIQFNASGDEKLIKAFKDLANAQGKFNKATQSSTSSVNKQDAQHKKMNAGMMKLRASFKAQGKSLMDAGVSSELYRKALRGQLVAIERVNIAVKKYRIEQDKANLSTRILGGSIAVLRSKLLIAAFAVALLKKPITDMLNAFAEATDVQSKFNVVFGETTEIAGAFAVALGKDFGRATTEIKKFMAGLQDTFVPLGFSRVAAAKLSAEVVELGYNVASLSGRMDADVMLAFQSALVGNHETLKTMGIIINENVLFQKAFEMGLAKTKGELTEQDKVLARVALMHGATADAMNNVNITSGDLRNQIKQTAGTWTKFKENMGEVLEPLAQFMLVISRVLLKLSEWGHKLADQISLVQKSKQVLEFFTTAFRLMDKAITGSSGIEKARKDLENLNDEIVLATAGMTFFGESVGDAFTSIEQKLQPFLDMYSKTKEGQLELLNVKIELVEALFKEVGWSKKLAVVYDELLEKRIKLLGLDKKIITANETTLESFLKMHSQTKEGQLALLNVKIEIIEALFKEIGFNKQLADVYNMLLEKRLKLLELDKEKPTLDTTKIDALRLEIETRKELFDITISHLSQMVDKLQEFHSIRVQNQLDADLAILDSERTAVNESRKSSKRKKVELDKIQKAEDKLRKDAHNKGIAIKIKAAIADSAISIGQIAMAASTARQMALVQALGNPLLAAPLIAAITTQQMLNTGLTIAQGAAAVTNLNAQRMATGGLIGGRRHSQGGTMIEAEQGEFVMSRNAVDAVGLETMNRINQGRGGGGVNVTFTGNVMSQDFIENEAIPQIKEAIRRGADIGIS